MKSSFYTQHELTPQEIEADRRKAAAIARNRPTGPRAMTEMRHFKDVASEPARLTFEGLLREIAKVNPEVHATASAWWYGTDEAPGIRNTICKEMVSNAINRLRVRIAEASSIQMDDHKAEIQRREIEADRQVARDKMNRDSATLASMRVPVSVASSQSWRMDENRAMDQFSDVPNGYYAVANDAGVLTFYRVSTYKNSINRKVQIQASDELHFVRGFKATYAILAKIREVTAPVAGLRYAHEIGNCYRCGRTLTDAESRARGIGPVCVDK